MLATMGSTNLDIGDFVKLYSIDGSDFMPSAYNGHMYKLLGFIFVGFAFLGILPGIPCTPFLLLAAWCFARSSEKWHRWLLSNPIFGPLIHNWQHHQCISMKTKWFSISTMIICGGGSIAFGLSNIYLQCTTGALILIGFIFVMRIKVCTPNQCT